MAVAQRVGPTAPSRPGDQQLGTRRNGVVNPNGSASDLTGSVPRTGAGLSPRRKLPQPKFNSVYEVQRAIIRWASNILAQSDVAWRENRKLQRMMLHDPDIMSPLLQRQTAVALLPWDIVPEDDEDETQVAQAKELANDLRHRFRGWNDYLRHMQESVWYGTSAANILYQLDRRDKRVLPTGWLPLHGDSLVWNDIGDIGMKVQWNYSREETVMTFFGPAVMFDDLDRQALTVNTWYRRGPDYEDPYEARELWGGRGLRSTLYYTWFLKQTILRLWTTYAERYGMGIRKGYYPRADAEGEDYIDEVLNNLVDDVNVTLPMEMGPDGQMVKLYDVEIAEPNTGTQNVFASLINDYLGGQIKEMIIGQSATTEATSTGLGSDVGTRHAETFARLIQFDALTLQDSLTADLIQPWHEMRFGDTDWQPRFEFNVEDVDSEEWMAGVERFVNLGGEVSQRQARKRLGIEEPRKGEPMLQSESARAGAMFDFDSPRPAGRSGGDRETFQRTLFDA